MRGNMFGLIVTLRIHDERLRANEFARRNEGDAGPVDPCSRRDWKGFLWMLQRNSALVVGNQVDGGGRVDNTTTLHVKK